MRSALALAGLVFLIVILSIARRSSPTFPVSDEAVIELSTLNALHGHQLLGPYSRYGWNHPGPALYYLLAPFYGLSGERSVGLAAGALAINMAGVGLIVWILFTRGGPSLAIGFALFVAAYLARLDGLLASSWNAHVAILAAMGVIVSSAAVAAGSVGMIPLFVVLASVVVQTHVALLPLVAIAGLFVGVGLGLAATSRRVGPVLNLAAWTALVLWLLPIVEQMAPTGGNVTEMWQFATGRSGGAAPAIAFEAWAGMLTAAVRPGLELPRGLLLPHDGVGWVGVAAAIELCLLFGAAWWAYRRGRRFHAWLAFELLVVAVAALWAASRIPDGIHDHEVLWIAAVGLLSIVAIVDVLIVIIGQRSRPTWNRPVAWFSNFNSVGLFSPADAALKGPRHRHMAATVCLVTSGRPCRCRRPRGEEPRGPVAGDDAGRRENRSGDAGRRSGDRAHRRAQAEDAHRSAGLGGGRRCDPAASKKGEAASPSSRGWRTMLSGTVAADGTEDLEITFCGGPCHARVAARADNTVVLLGDGIAIDAIVLKP